jgi:hypothetical protein
LYDRKQSGPFNRDAGVFRSRDYGLKDSQNGLPRVCHRDTRLIATLIRSAMRPARSTATVDNFVGNPTAHRAKARKRRACDRLLKT